MLGGTVPIQKYSIWSSYFYPKSLPFNLFQYFFRKYSLCKFKFVRFESSDSAFWTLPFLVLVALCRFSCLLFLPLKFLFLRRTWSLLIFSCAFWFDVFFCFGMFHRVYSRAAVPFWQKPFSATMSFRQSKVRGTLVFWQRLLTLF